MFLTSAAKVLVSLRAAASRTSTPTYRIIADELGLTERHVLSIIKQLENKGYVKVNRDGRNNTYEFTSMADRLVPHIKEVQGLTV